MIVHYTFKDIEYKIIISELSEEDGGGYLAEVIDCPGCMTDGETVGEAVESMKKLLPFYLEVRAELLEKR